LTASQSETLASQQRHASMDVSLVSVCDPLATPLPVRACPFAIGRGEECDLRLSNVLVSRRHAELRVVKGRLRAYDCGSLNGTAVNGKLAGRDGIELRDGDHLSVATTVFLVRIVAAGEPKRPADSANSSGTDETAGEITAIRSASG
jgi:pSer/pThr/pTyr-binding forkhead associated (FHA) protein